MNIGPEQIERTELAGHTAKGGPIIYVLTKGGLHAFFTREDNKIVALGAAPHRAIASWLVEQKDPGVKWEDAFVKEAEMAKAEDVGYAEKYEKLRRLMFSPAVDGPVKSEDRYLLCTGACSNCGQKIELVSRAEIDKRLKKGECQFAFVRHLSLTDEVQLVCEHPLFKDIHEA